MKWTKSQKDLLHSQKSNEEIATETGRSLRAVENARTYYTGHTTTLDKARPNNEERMAKAYGEARILDLAKKMNIKIERGK